VVLARFRRPGREHQAASRADGGTAFSIILVTGRVQVAILTLQTLNIQPKNDAKSPCGRRGLPIPINRRMTKAGPSNRKLAPIAKFNQPKDSRIERNSFLRRPLSQNRT